MSGKRPKVVIAGSYRQFREWCRANNIPPNQAIYADHNDRLMGLELSEDDVVFTGEHWLSPIDRDLLRTRIRLPKATL